MNLRVCIFCGSAAGKGDEYLQQAQAFGEMLAQEKCDLIYGGASIGVMGKIADVVLENGRRVVGVMPQSLVEWEVAHPNLSEFRVVDTMHQRKQLMYDESDVFIALPGGMGTLDELCEIVTWAQLKYHEKPCFVYNLNGFYDHLLKHLDHCVDQGFLSQAHRLLIKEIRSLEEAREILKQSASS